MKRNFTFNGDMWEGKKINYNTSGYPRVTINKKSVPIHLLVWRKANGQIPKGCQVHHKDFNKKNYGLENLELLVCQQHQRLHAGWIRNEKGVWIAKPCMKCGKTLALSEFWARRTGSPNLHSYCKKCFNDKEKMSKYYKTEEYRKRNRIRLRETRKKQKEVKK